MALDSYNSNIQNLKNLSLAELPAEIKQNVPEEIVFARVGGGKVDLSSSLKVTDNSQVKQTIETTSNRPLTLVVKPEANKPVKSIKGYLVFKKRFSESEVKNIVSCHSNNIALITPAYAQEAEEFLKTETTQSQIEDLLVLMEFEYTDSDNDGLYTADINTPYVSGEYEIITVLEYQNQIVPKILRLTTIIDPEGYVFEKIGKNETRITNAKVSLFKFNELTKQYELWDAQNFSQSNPQITSQTGEYSFLVVEGDYQIKVEADGYKTYLSQSFTAKDGDSFHDNIELKSFGFKISQIIWNIIFASLLVILIGLIIFNLIIKKRL